MCHSARTLAILILVCLFFLLKSKHNNSTERTQQDSNTNGHKSQNGESKAQQRTNYDKHLGVMGSIYK